MPSTRSLVFCLGLIAAGAGHLAAADPDLSAALAAVNQSADAFRQAYAQGDSKKIASLFTEAAEFVDGDENVFHGREAIEEEYAAFFQIRRASTVQIDVENVRFVAPGVLMEEGTATVLSAGDLPATRSSYVAVHTRQPDGRWLIASVRSGRDQPLSPHENLKSLNWLVGRWVDESADSVVVTRWRWSEDGNFLLSDFEAKVEGTPVIKGTQRVGWDASRQKARSWVFDSEGGFAEGIWTPSDGGWIVKLTGVRSDGQTASATIKYQLVGQDTLVWTAQDRVSGDEILPDLQVTVVRGAPQPESAD